MANVNDGGNSPVGGFNLYMLNERNPIKIEADRFATDGALVVFQARNGEQVYATPVALTDHIERTTH
ncbi:MAG: hypothetical protein PGN27_25080 [Mycolicibacterium neoaurum]|uniref:hypothetical protein n=1 Tax=Mycolicibacterium neoaurum TaxID=1795 RepID=UPI002FF7AFC6